MKQSPDELLEKTNEFFSAENNTESKFYELREEFNALESKDMRKSALFVYLNSMRSTVCVVTIEKGLFNVPYGRYKSPKCPLKEMQAFSVKGKICNFQMSGL